MGFDGLFVIKPDGTDDVQSGIGNLGTESVFDVHRVAAELVGMAWDKVDITWGNSAKYLPYTCNQGGSQTTHAMTRAAHAAAWTPVEAAGDCGESPRRHAGELSGGRRTGLQRWPQPDARAGGGQKAIELGGSVRRPRVPENINATTKTSAAALAGQGLMGVARDTYGRDGTSKSYVAGFAEVEVDVETGHYKIVDFLAVADCGTVIHPRNLRGQTLGGIMLGIGHAIGQNWVYDQHYGVPLAKRFYQTKPPTHSRRARCRMQMGGARYSGSGDAGGRARHWRSAGWRRIHGGHERDCRRRWPRRLPPCPGDGGHHPDVARGTAAAMHEPLTANI